MDALALMAPLSVYQECVAQLLAVEYASLTALLKEPETSTILASVQAAMNALLRTVSIINVCPLASQLSLRDTTMINAIALTVGNADQACVKIASVSLTVTTVASSGSMTMVVTVL